MSSTLSTLDESTLTIRYMEKPIETLAERVRRSREEAGLTQLQLAQKAGISAAAIGLIETGDTRAIKSENVFPLARAMNKNPEWLATGNGPESAHAGVETAIAALPVTAKIQLLDYLQFQLERMPCSAMAMEQRAKYIALIESAKNAKPVIPSGL